MDRPKCAGCIFWDAPDDHRNLGFSWPCKVDGPQLDGASAGGRWPYTRAADWCGKHRAIKVKKEPAEQPVTL